MKKMDRRQLLTCIAAGTLAGMTAPSWGQAAKAPASKPKAAAKLASKLRIVIPANAGGGWDQTGRALGTAMISAGVVDEIDYENKGGKGGTIGLAYYAEKYAADPNTLIMGGTVIEPGNVSPVAEANIWNDPHAADLVFTAGWKLSLGRSQLHRPRYEGAR